VRSHTVLGHRYRLEKRLSARDGQEAYLAFDALLHRPVTVYLPAGGPDAERHRSAFVQRYQTAVSLNHRNIIAILDLGDEQGRPYAVAEQFAGDTLARIIQDEAPFDIDDVAILIEQLAAGLEHAKQQGIVHGHLTPHHVIVDAAGLARIQGFGMVEGQFLLESGSREELAPSPYRPSAIRGNTPASHALDVHALATISYHMLTGQPPVPMQVADHAAPYAAEAHGNPSRIVSSVPPRAGEVVADALQAYGELRLLTARQYSEILTHWRSMATLSARNAYGPSRSSSRQAAQSAPARHVRSDSSHRGNSVVSGSASRPTSRSRYNGAFLIGLLLVFSIVAVGLAMTQDSSQIAATAAEMPDELARLLRVTGN
jgi:eukaryotic-like serine/threonine-protein kinase